MKNPITLISHLKKYNLCCNWVTQINIKIRLKMYTLIQPMYKLRYKSCKITKTMCCKPERVLKFTSGSYGDMYVFSTIYFNFCMVRELQRSGCDILRSTFLLKMHTLFLITNGYCRILRITNIIFMEGFLRKQNLWCFISQQILCKLTTYACLRNILIWQVITTYVRRKLKFIAASELLGILTFILARWRVSLGSSVIRKHGEVGSSFRRVWVSRLDMPQKHYIAPRKLWSTKEM